jgi:hypothetical protein
VSDDLGLCRCVDPRDRDKDVAFVSTPLRESDDASLSPYAVMASSDVSFNFSHQVAIPKGIDDARQVE